MIAASRVIGLMQEQVCPIVGGYTQHCRGGQSLLWLPGCVYEQGLDDTIIWKCLFALLALCVGND